MTRLRCSAPCRADCLVLASSGISASMSFGVRPAKISPTQSALTRAMLRKNFCPSAVRLTICTRRSFGSGRRRISPCSARRSTRPVMLPFDTIMRCDSSPSVMPFGARSSCASRSKRGRVMSNWSRRRRRTSFSIKVVQVSSRSHSRNSVLWSSGRSETLVSASSGMIVRVVHQISPPAITSVVPVTAAASGEQDKARPPRPPAASPGGRAAWP